MTSPTLLGVILLTSEYSVNFAKNFIKYLAMRANTTSTQLQCGWPCHR